MTDTVRRFLANSPAGVTLCETLELRHAQFLMLSGSPGPMRLFLGTQPFSATLEAGAPLNSGEIVTFEPYSFDVVNPPISEKSDPHTNIRIDNVDRWAINNIERAVSSLEPIEMTYRAYLSNDLSAPIENPPLHLILSDISADIFQIRATAKFADFGNKSFPREVYGAIRFPGIGL